jgi:hypothetical protein
MGHQPIFEGDREEGAMRFILTTVLIVFSLLSPPAFARDSFDARVLKLEEDVALHGKTIHVMLEILDALISGPPNGLHVSARPISFSSDDPPGQRCVIYDPLTGTSRNISCEEAWRIRTDAEPPCLAQMEAAMRAREEWAKLTDEDRLWTRVTDDTHVIDGSWHSDGNILYYGDIAPYENPPPPDTRTQEQRLEDEQKALDKRKADLAQQRIDEAHQRAKDEITRARLANLKSIWELAKQECWRQP